MANNIHVENWGHKIVATITDQDGAIVPLNLATTKEFIFKRSTGDIVTTVGVFESGADGTDGKFHYYTVPGLVHAGGSWSVQAHVVGPDYDYHTDDVPFTVDDNLEADPV